MINRCVVTKRKRSFSIKDTNGEDKISSLPDDLLHRIMSFLNAKHAVGTCVLSKRWTNLWKSLPYLDFDFRTFPYSGLLTKSNNDIRLRIEEREEEKRNCFSKFITQVLLRRHPTTVVKVRFYSPSNGKDPLVAESLISYAVEHKVEELDVHVCFDKPFVLPKSFYKCQSLRALKLVTVKESMTLHGYLGLSSLKSLYLDGIVIMKGKNLYPWLFPGCPNLESLKFVDILFDSGSHETLTIHGLNLKSLEVSYLWCKPLHRRSRFKVAIHAPKLTTLKYAGYPQLVCSADNLASLDQLYFDLHSPWSGLEEDRVVDVISILNEFSHAKSLTLSSSTIKVLSQFPALVDEHRLSFANLKHLKLNDVRAMQQRGKFKIPGFVLNCFLSSSTLLELC